MNKEEQKKPSERIKEIHSKMNKVFAPESIAQAIMHYLDEEYEKLKRKI